MWPRDCVRSNLIRASTSVQFIVSDESEKEEVLADLQSNSNLSAVLEVNFTVMMEVVFMCEEFSKLKTRMDTEVVEEVGFYGSLIQGFKVI